jgi:hypothetical protein
MWGWLCQGSSESAVYCLCWTPHGCLELIVNSPDHYRESTVYCLDWTPHVLAQLIVGWQRVAEDVVAPTKVTTAAVVDVR